MDHTWVWIPLTLFAALMQSVRTAAQKQLNQRMSTMGTTYVRSLFGMPALLLFLFGVLWHTGLGWPDFNAGFVLYTAGGALTQVLATALLIHMFRLRNFAVGTMLTKTDLIMTAVLGMLLFAERITPLGWAAICLTMGGVILMLLGRSGGAVGAAGATWTQRYFGPTTRVALGCALLFSFSYLFLRAGTLALGTEHHFLWRSGWSVVLANALQIVVLGLWLAWREPAVFSQMRPLRGLANFIGVTSALGSIGWYSALALQNASYVRAVGQVEAVFTLAISWLYFREKISPLELAGIAVTVAGVLMFRLV